jgi:ABC-type Mn2+/Zn2+ transport system permease subunit
MMAISSLVGAFSAIIGLYLSFYINIASGAAVVLVATGIFIMVFLFAPHKGVLWRQMSKMRAPLKG